MFNASKPVWLSSGVRTVLSNATSLGVANIGSRVLALVYIAMLTRLAGVHGVGTYSLATAIGGYVLFVADLGLNNYVIQHASANQKLIEQLFNSVLRLKLFLLVFVLPVIIILSYSIGDDTDQVSLIVIISTAFTARSFSTLNYAVLTSQEKMVFEAIITLLKSLLFVILAYTMLNQFKLLFWVGIAYLIAELFELSISNWIRKKLLFSSNLSSASVNWKLMISGLPFGINSLVSTAFTQIDVVIIALIASLSLVGEYAIVSRLLLATSVIPVVFGYSVWPRIARLYLLNKARFRQLVTWFWGVNLAIGMALLLMFTTTSETILTIILLL